MPRRLANTVWLGSFVLAKGELAPTRWLSIGMPLVRVVMAGSSISSGLSVSIMKASPTSGLALDITSAKSCTTST